MKVAWKGDGSNVLATKAFGIIFPVGEARDVSHLPKAFRDKLRNNQTFEVVADEERGLEVQQEDEPQEDERDALIAEGAELGLDLDKRMRADTMRERIAAKRAELAEAEEVEAE